MPLTPENRSGVRPVKSLLLEKLLPTPKRRIEVDYYGRYRLVEPGEEPKELGKLRVDIDPPTPIITYSIMLAAPIVGIGRSGVETDASRIRRATKPIQRVKEVVSPPKLISGKELFDLLTKK